MYCTQFSAPPINSHLRSRLFKQIVTYTPSITSIPPEQFRASQIEDLPPIPPRQRALLTIRLDQPLPNTLLILQHSNKPILTRLGVMHARNPPLLLNPEIILEEQQ